MSQIIDGKDVRTVAVDPERAALVTWAFEAYATGDWTLTRLLKELTARGLTNRATAKYPERPLRPSHLHSTLGNPYYKGDVAWRGVIYTGRHPRLVDDETWQRVQDVLAAHRVGEKQRGHPHYLKSTIYCGSCERDHAEPDSRFIVTHAKNRYGTVYPYFICLGRHQKRTDCVRKATLTADIEQLVEDHYRQVVLAPDLHARLKDLLTAELQRARAQTKDDERHLTQRRQQLLNERAKLLQAHYAGAVPLDLLKTEQDRIGTDLAHIDHKLLASDASFDQIEQNLAAALDLATDCHRAYRLATPQVRRFSTRRSSSGYTSTRTRFAVSLRSRSERCSVPNLLTC